MFDSLLKIDYPPHCKSIAYADDFIILVAAKMPLELEATGNQILRDVEKWKIRNKTNFNPKKSQAIHFSRSHTKFDFKLYFNGKQLEMVENLKYLGITFDRTLSWNTHIDNVTKKCSQTVNCLSRIAKVNWGLGHKALRTIYNGAFIPMLLYAVPVWAEGLSRVYNKTKLKRVQRTMAIRVARGYRTLSYEAACIVANVKPILLKAEELVKYSAYKHGITTEWVNPASFEKPVSFRLWSHPGSTIAVQEVMSSAILPGCDVYTDGSKSDEKVGCAFVAFRHGDITKQELFRLEEGCSNNQAEQLAILKALDWICSEGSEIERNFTVCTDSRVALDCIKNNDNHFPLVEMIRKHIDSIMKKGVTLKFKWIKAHAGQEGNELADKLAKAASKDKIPAAYSLLPPSRLKSQLEKSTEIEWNRQWISSSNGALTREFFPSVKDRNSLEDSALTFQLTQLLTGHGKFASYLHRFNIYPSPACSCDSLTPQTVHHMLYDCPGVMAARSALVRKVMLLGFHWPLKKKELIKEEWQKEFRTLVTSIFSYIEEDQN